MKLIYELHGPGLQVQQVSRALYCNLLQYASQHFRYSVTTTVADYYKRQTHCFSILYTYCQTIQYIIWLKGPHISVVSTKICLHYTVPVVLIILVTAQQHFKCLVFAISWWLLPKINRVFTQTKLPIDQTFTTSSICVTNSRK